MEASMKIRSFFAVAVALAAGSVLSADTLHSNGGFVTHPGQGAGGADAAQVDTGFFGIGHVFYPGGSGTEYRVAEDFTVTGDGWEIEKIRIYGYSTIQTGNPVPPAPFTAIVMNIWDGHPRAAGSSIVAVSTTLGPSQWTGAYRVDNGNLTQDTRPIYAIEAVFANTTLPVGTYWYDVQVTGGDPTTPYVMDGLVNADGNAMNLFLDAIGFNPIRYGTPQRGLAFPFEVIGEQVGGGGCYANCDGSTVEPVLNVADFSCFLGKFAAGEPYANCDESTVEPVLNVADFSCFLGKFAAGCR
jgi:hypothetical protein